MAVSTWLHRRINTVVEDTIEAEARYIMANAAIHGHNGMAYRLPRRIRAIVTTRTIVRDVTVVNVGILKTVRRVTEATVILGRKMTVILTDGCSAVVAGVASPGNTRMIKTAIGSKREKADSVVTVITLSLRCDMKLGFTNRQHAVMASAAITKNLKMINKTE
jgi:hypothetical protein